MPRRIFRKRLGRRGNAAVEFAIFAPFMILMFMGTIEIATAYRTYAKLNAVVANVAEEVRLSQAVTTGALTTEAAASSPWTSLGAQVQEVSLPDLCKGAILGTAPYPSGGMTLNIASITAEPATEAETVTQGAPAAFGSPDAWEYDQTVSAGSCAPVGGTAILSNAAIVTPLTGSASTAMIVVPCDNVIIVQASLPYSGLFGLIFNSNSPFHLSQTAYVRWSSAQAGTELMCDGCTTQGSTQFCNANNIVKN